jgi:hypothetical protein
MLNDKFLQDLSGGALDFLSIFRVLKLDLLARSTTLPVLDLTGISGFIGGLFGSMFGGVSGGSFSAMGDDGTRGRVTTVGVTVKPAAFGTNLTFKEQHIKVLNADSVRDMKGMQLSVGAVASLPTRVQDKLAEKGVHAGELFAVAYPNGKGAEVSLPFDRGGDALIKVSSDSTTAFVTGVGTGVTGVEVYATLSFSDVKVESADRIAQMAYYESKK